MGQGCGYVLAYPMYLAGTVLQHANIMPEHLVDLTSNTA